ncbi:TVP38/TMEM64 family protein [Enterococcus hermanniensis]|uniref:TVP38/TMEM64 family protein n=1 Tax=Enterococcus hermanniensis TaxID=249189 RepID=UPI00090018B0|nr:VTT domain-containing protein [Enterococcus hermanniensis]
MNKKRVKTLLIVFGILLMIILGYHLYLQYQQDIHLFIDPKTSKARFVKEVQSHGMLSALLLIGLTTMMCAVPGVPTSVVGVISGLSFGPLLGSIINILGNTIGNTIAIYCMSKFKLFDKKEQSNHWIQSITELKHPRIGLMLGYMVPVIPSSVINITAEALKLPLKEILLSIVIGVIPSSILYACGGDTLIQGISKPTIILVIGIIVLISLIVVIYKKEKKKLHL